MLSVIIGLILGAGITFLIMKRKYNIIENVNDSLANDLNHEMNKIEFYYQMLKKLERDYIQLVNAQFKYKEEK